MRLHAHVAGTIRLRPEDAPEKLIERLRRDLSFPNPEYIKRRRLNLGTHGISERICCLNHTDDGWIEIPRGAVQILRERAREYNIHLFFRNQRTVNPTTRLQAAFQLRHYQQIAKRSMRMGVQGLVVMPCGAGKTITALSALESIRQQTLIIVHTKDLLDQWKTAVRDMFLFDAGIISEGSFSIDTITIATIQTLVRMSEDKLGQLGRQFGCVIVDESHIIPSSMFQSVLSQMPAKYRYGLTATPYREDGLTKLIEYTLGERLYQIDQKELMRDGHLEKPEIRQIATSFTFDYQGSEDFQPCMKALVDDTERNALITNIAVKDAKDNHSALVLSNRVEHCKRLAELISRQDIETGLLIGSVKKNQRTRILEEFKAGSIKIVVASTLADEGLDVPRLDRVILAYPSRAKGRTVQRLGRVMRPFPGKRKSILYDLMDEAIPVLKRQAAARQRCYQQIIGE